MTLCFSQARWFIDYRQDAAGNDSADVLARVALGNQGGTHRKS